MLHSEKALSEIPEKEKQLVNVLRQMIALNEEELQQFMPHCFFRTYARKEYLSRADQAADEVFFVHSGLIRVVIEDKEGQEHTVHFAMENQFIAEYSAFLTQEPAAYSLQALEKTEVTVMPRAAIDWGYARLREGEKLGRQIAEYYFIYLDRRVKNMYALRPTERYEQITKVFPDIHNRAPQYMIASYLGISPVHLSRLKRRKP